VLPALSVAAQVTVVAPSGNVAPEAGEQVGVIGPSTRSVAVGAVHEETAPAATVASLAMLLGMPAITGGAVSATGAMANGEKLVTVPQMIPVPSLLVVTSSQAAPPVG